MLAIAREAAEQVLKHLRRAGHDRLGESHVVYPSPGTWSIETDVPGCDYGLLQNGVRGRRSFSARENERIEQGKVKECTCGYLAAIAMLEEASEEHAKKQEAGN